jgi:hypothetical protein
MLRWESVHNKLLDITKLTTLKQEILHNQATEISANTFKSIPISFGCSNAAVLANTAKVGISAQQALEQQQTMLDRNQCTTN